MRRLGRTRTAAELYVCWYLPAIISGTLTYRYDCFFFNYAFLYTNLRRLRNSVGLFLTETFSKNTLRTFSCFKYIVEHEGVDSEVRLWGESGQRMMVSTGILTKIAGFVVGPTFLKFFKCFPTQLDTRSPFLTPVLTHNTQN